MRGGGVVRLGASEDERKEGLDEGFWARNKKPWLLTTRLHDSLVYSRSPIRVARRLMIAAVVVVVIGPGSRRVGLGRSSGGGGSAGGSGRI